MKETLGNKIKALRKIKNLSQEKLANKAELSQQHISRIEKDLTFPCVATLTKIAKLYGTIAEVPLYNKYREFNLKVKDYSINLFLPKIDINENVREYISEDIGVMLYEVIVKKLGKDFVCKGMNRYIPETRNEQEESVKQLFKKYFYQVVLYKERKPGIYTEFDDHIKSVIVLGFFKRIIAAYLEYPTAGKHS